MRPPAPVHGDLPLERIQGRVVGASVGLFVDYGERVISIRLCHTSIFGVPRAIEGLPSSNAIAALPCAFVLKGRTS